jgi:hypothetical protein
MAENKTPRRGYVRTLGSHLEEAAGEVMQAWRAQAKRRDRVGDVSYHGLEVVHGGLEVTVRSLSRLERATQPPHRAARPEPHPPAVETAIRRPARHGPAPTASAHHQPRPEPESSTS